MSMIPPANRIKTTDERLDAIEKNLRLLVGAVQDIAQELGIRARIRVSLTSLDEANGHDTEPAPAPEGE